MKELDFIKLYKKLMDLEMVIINGPDENKLLNSYKYDLLEQSKIIRKELYKIKING